MAHTRTGYETRLKFNIRKCTTYSTPLAEFEVCHDNMQIKYYNTEKNEIRYTHLATRKIHTTKRYARSTTLLILRYVINNNNNNS